MSNDIQEIYKIFGTEAVRNYIIEEISILFAQQDVEMRHIELLVDCMTHRGTPIPITRHGWRHSSLGPLSKSSFKESARMLTLAGAYSQFDNMEGVSSNIMAGQIARAGTGFNDVSIDLSKLTNTQPIDDIIRTSASSTTALQGTNLDKDAILQPSNPPQEDNFTDFEIQYTDNV